MIINHPCQLCSHCTMKFSAATLSLLLAPSATVLADNHASCTHGKLYLLDDTTSDVHVIDVSKGNLENLSVEGKVTLPESGAGGLVYYGPPGDPLVVQFRNTPQTGFDGWVRVIDTGFEPTCGDDDSITIEYEAPEVAGNAIMDDCYLPIHQVRHDNKVAIFCDGQNLEVDPTNTTIYIVDNTKIGTDAESAIQRKLVLPGAHHGVAIPVDDGHVMHSIASQGRIDRVPGSPGLPATFQVVNDAGEIIHELTDTSDPDLHCAGFHGSASVDNTFLLGCDEVHGGVLLVNYDPETETYESRAVEYPSGPEYDDLRVGSFAYHKSSPYAVGRFAQRNGNQTYLIALDYESTTIDESKILAMPEFVDPCGWMFEAGAGKHFLTYMPDGNLIVWKIEDGSFVKVMEQMVVPGVNNTCTGIAFTVGIEQAFVAIPENQTLIALDLHEVDNGEIEMFESQLPFTPTGMLVSGFSLEAACGGKGFPDDFCNTSAGSLSFSGGFFITVASVGMVIASLFAF